MADRKYVIMGATGKIGQTLVEALLKRGHTVIALGRDQKKLESLKKKGADARPAKFDDASSLAQVYRGADAVFSLIPPSFGEDDFGAYQDRVGEAITKAIKEAGVKRILNLSSIGANLADGTGPVKGLHRHEKRLDNVDNLDILHLRPCYFMQNLYWSVPAIKSYGVIGSSLRANLPLWMVATQDIGLKAAELLDNLAFKGRSIFEFVGPRQVTMNEVTTVLGKAIGKPDMKYVQREYEEEKKAMVGGGMKPGIAELMVEMSQAFNESKVIPTQTLDTEHRGNTTLESFAVTFAGAYKAS